MTWEEVRERKLSTRKRLLRKFAAPDGAIPDIDDLDHAVGFIDSSDLLSGIEKKITNSSIMELLARYQEGQTAVEVVTAFCHRATLAHQLTNCLTEIRFAEALEEARQLDRYYAENHSLVGPLHGIVVSIKDGIDVAGLDTTMGLIGLAENPVKTDAVSVQMLKKMGAIVIAKTNTPTGMIYTQCYNELWGWTWNPYGRKHLNVGGSSGGEGAFGALRGSCVGVGTDIGGSVRHPAALNNLFSIKPSVGRIPGYGDASGNPGQESIISVPGLMSWNLENVTYTLKQLIDAKPYLFDSGCLPIDYRPYTMGTLTVGIMRSDGLTTFTPPVQRGLDMVKDALTKEGHSVIEWSDKLFPELREALYPFYGAGGSQFMKKVLAKSSEPIDPHLVNSMKNAKVMPVSELWQHHQRRTALVQQYHKRWLDAGLDAVIISTSAFPVCIIGHVPSQPCTSVWNALDYSATTFPVTEWDRTHDVPVERTRFISDVDKECYNTYKDNFEKFEGAPVALQVVCGRLEEEKALSITKYINSII